MRKVLEGMGVGVIAWSTTFAIASLVSACGVGTNPLRETPVLGGDGSSRVLAQAVGGRTFTGTETALVGQVSGSLTVVFSSGPEGPIAATVTLGAKGKTYQGTVTGTLEAITVTGSDSPCTYLAVATLTTPNVLIGTYTATGPIQKNCPNKQGTFTLHGGD